MTQLSINLDTQLNEKIEEYMIRHKKFNKSEVARILIREGLRRE